MTLHLHGIGHAHPRNEITNRFLEDLDIGTTDDWIVERVGIHSRRTALSLDYIRETKNADVREARAASVCSTADLSREAAEMALERAGVSPEDVGLVVLGSCASDSSTPAESCVVAGQLGIEAPGIDVNSACTSFLAQVHLLSMLRPEVAPRFILMVAVDALTRAVDYRDRATAVLWGDGATAAVVSLREPGQARIVSPALESEPAKADKVVVPHAGYFAQDGPSVQMFAIRKGTSEYQRLVAVRGEAERPLHFVGHQANLRALESTCQRCEIPPELHHSNVASFGNTGAAGSGSVISMEWEKWKPGDDVAVVGVGAGLTWGGYLLQFDGHGTRGTA